MAAARVAVHELMRAEAGRLKALREAEEADGAHAVHEGGDGEGEGAHVDGSGRPKLRMGYEARRRKVQLKVWPGFHTGQRPSVHMNEGEHEIDVPLPKPRTLDHSKQGGSGHTGDGRGVPAPAAPAFDGWAGLKKKPKEKLMIGGIYGESGADGTRF